jgi:hypothetical protein
VRRWVALCCEVLGEAPAFLCRSRWCIVDWNATAQAHAWWHVHKAAGSYMCEAAKTFEKVVSPLGNCNWNANDMFCQPGGVSCEVRAAYFARQGATWGAVEHAIQPSDICPQFSYGTILRHPLSLMRSNHNFDNHMLVRSPLPCRVLFPHCG